MSRVLITGMGGFLGSHLAEHLQAEGHTVAGTVRGGLPPDFGEGAATAISCDIVDAGQVEDVVGLVRPEVVFHLAAQSLPALSWQDPGATFRVNVMGTVNLLEALRRAQTDPVIVIAGSSAEYGPAGPDNGRISEDAAISPSSPYGASKAAADRVACFYGRALGMKVVRARPFQAIGPRKVGDVCSDLARGIVAVERGIQPALRVGNLKAVRDFLDVRDVVRACWTIARRGTPGRAYNICSGEGRSVRDVLDMLLPQATCTIRAEPDPSRIRRDDQPAVVGDNSRLRVLGWAPAIPLVESLAAVLDYWRQRGAKAEPAAVPLLAREARG